MRIRVFQALLALVMVSLPYTSAMGDTDSCTLANSADCSNQFAEVTSWWLAADDDGQLHTSMTLKDQHAKKVSCSLSDEFKRPVADLISHPEQAIDFCVVSGNKHYRIKKRPIDGNVTIQQPTHFRASFRIGPSVLAHRTVTDASSPAVPVGGLIAIDLMFPLYESKRMSFAIGTPLQINTGSAKAPFTFLTFLAAGELSVSLGATKLAWTLGGQLGYAALTQPSSQSQHLGNFGFRTGMRYQTRRWHIGMDPLSVSVYFSAPPAGSAEDTPTPIAAFYQWQAYAGFDL